jgi:acyl carrier protein
MPMTADDALALFRDLLEELGSKEIAEKLSADMTVKDLEMDSLELLEFLMLVDDRSGVEIAAEEADFDTALGEIAALVSQRSA